MDAPGFEIDGTLYESRCTLICRARRTVDGQAVILKVLKDEAATPDVLAGFTREFNFTSRIDDPGVIKAYALHKHNGSLMMELEDIGGRSLDLALEAGPLPTERFLELAVALADTVGAVHRQHVIHKDINPCNIIWNPESDRIQMIDFGLAEDLLPTTVGLEPPASLEGSLAYISPEQTGRMNRPVDYRTDFYSLGVTFYEMLTGGLPFGAEDAMGMVHYHIAGMPITPHGVSIPQSPRWFPGLS